MNNPHTTVHTWRRWLFIALPPLAAVLFALALVMPALAATVFNVNSPFNETVTNPCNGENVTISGTEHEMLHVTLDGNGGFHGDMQANLHDVTGVGDQGNTYHVPGAFHDNLNGKVGQEETETETFNFISDGSAPNFLLHIDFHFTINADGTLTSSHDTFRTECKG